MIITDIPRNNNTSKKIKLAAYCRVSTNSAEQIHSFMAQVKYYRDYEKNNPQYQLIGVYADEGITGTSMNKRDEFNRMLQDCRDGKINRIVVKSASRFARNNEEALRTLRELKDLNVSVFFEKERIDTETMNSEFIISLFGMNAQQESMTMSDNMRWSYQHRMRSGEFNTCKAPLGYKLEDGKLVIVEEEALIIRRIFDMFLSGKGKYAITKILNKEGVGQEFGIKRWYPSEIVYILSNERYMGDARLQKRYTSTTLPYRLMRNRGEKEQFYVENSNDAIVDRDVFLAAQALIEQRKEQASTGSSGTSILNGLLRCPECGNAMRRISNVNRPKWWCRGYSLKTTTCSAHTVYEDDIFHAFTNMANKVKDNQRELIGDTISLLEQLMRIAGSNKDRIHEIDVDIADLSKRKYTFAQLYEKKILSDKDYVIKSNDVESQLTKLRAERRKLLADDKSTEYLDELTALDRAISKYEKQTTLDTTLFEDIVNKIVVDDSGCITFHLLGGLKFTERIRK